MMDVLKWVPLLILVVLILILLIEAFVAVFRTLGRDICGKRHKLCHAIRTAGGG